MNTATRTHRTDSWAVVLLAMAVVLLFIHGPGLGDDFQYWWIAADLHLRGGEAWSAQGFHFLRWPVWGVAWILQAVFGPGVISYYGIPMLYVSLGALIAFHLGRMLFQNRAASWGCAFAYLFQPLLDDVIYRPMPDLSEGVLIAAAVLCWLALERRESARERLFLAVLTGGLCFLLFANRLTGVFVFGVLAAVSAVLAWKNRRFSPLQALLWLGVALAAFLALASLEGWIYYRLTGDFFHSITANLGARGRKGTEPVFLLAMPFRFFKSLWINGILGPVFTLLAFAGGWRMWASGDRRRRAVVAWAVTLYLAYNCALQSVFPPRPLLRTADRFLCALAVPMGVLGWEGLRWLWSLWPAGLAWTRKRPFATAALAFAALALVCSRGFFELGYLPELRAVVRKTPPGTRVFTHDTMRFAAMLADARAASRLRWLTTRKIFTKDPDAERLANEADEFWYCRKHIWLSVRKQMERDSVIDPRSIAPYLSSPHPDWVLERVVRHDDIPEFVFYKKRPRNTAQPRRVALGALFPEMRTVPRAWKRGEQKEFRRRFAIPETLRGKPLRLEIEGKSDTVEAFDVYLHFFREGKSVQTLQLSPYLQEQCGLDFQAFEIPAAADACEAELIVNPKTRSMEIDQLWLIAEP